MNERMLLFFDFDGVLCDSINECLLSSWLAYYKFYQQNEPFSVSLHTRSRFAALRPFIRDGQDYLLIHQLQQTDQHVSTQQEFDAYLAREGTARMNLFRDLFYQARNYLLGEDFGFWCRLNTLYPHLVAPLSTCLAHPDFYILSTKKPHYILEILKYNHLHIATERVLYPGEKPKHEIIREIMRQTGAQRAIFVDDQIDHLLKVEDNRIQTYLPSWGYIKQEWLSREIPVLQPHGLRQIFNLLPAVC